MVAWIVLLLLLRRWTFNLLTNGGGAAAAAAAGSEANYKGNQQLPNDLFALQPCPSRCLAAATAGARRKQKRGQRQRQQRRKAKAAPYSSKATEQRPFTSTDPTVSARIFYLILVHNERTANDAIFLFRAIRDPRNTIVIHYDKKVERLLDDGANHSTLLQEVRDCPCGSTVRVESVHAVEWSKWSMNLPTLWGMELATSNDFVDIEWDVFINLSGDTLPVYSANSMASKLGQLAPYNFVTSRSCETGLVPTSVYSFPKFWHKRRHYTRDGTEADPTFTYSMTPAATGTADGNVNNSSTQFYNKTLTVHFGSQWLILQRPFVEWLVRQLQDDTSWPSQFRNYLIQSQKLMTDETFIPTILMHTGIANMDDTEDRDDDDADFSGTIPVVDKESGALLYRNMAADDNRGRLNTQSSNRTGSQSSPRADLHHVRFERMDENMPTSYGLFPTDQRYQVPQALIESNTLEQPKVWGPYFLGVYDLGAIRASGALFARKVSALVDDNLVRMLPVDDVQEIPDIHWPKHGEISLTERPDWDAVLKSLKEEDHDEADETLVDADNDEEL